MPAINRTAVEYAIRIGLALNCTIAPWCRFARKNYFYPDMPKNFQTSQYDEPIAVRRVSGRRGRAARRCGSRSSARTWRRTPASPLHVGGADRPDLTAPSTRCWTTTGPACRWSRSSPRPIVGTKASAPGGGPGLRRRAAGSAEIPWRVRCSDGPGVAALRRQPVADAGRQPGARHPDRDQERQLAAVGGAGGPVRDHPAGGRSRGRRPDQAGDQALRRVDRDDGVGSVEGDRRGLPVLPRARPGAARPGRRNGWSRSGRRCRSCRGCGATGCRPTGASPIWRCATWSPPTRSSWSPPPSTRARRRRRPGPGGRPTWASRPTPAAWRLDELPITPAQLADVIGKVSRRAR